MLISGRRGMGKTVLLNALETVATAAGWEVISETATSGLVERLVTQHLPRLLAKHDPKATRRRLTGITAPANLGGAEWTNEDVHPAGIDLRSQITDLAEILDAKRGGLLVTLDEVDPASLADLTAFGTAIQHAFREELEVAFAAAGLPGAVDGVIKAPGLTFLVRADRHRLDSVERDDVERALRIPIERTGRSVSKSDLTKAIDATGRYPFMIQLVGYQVWRRNPTEPVISGADIEAGIGAANRRIGSLVVEPTLNGLPPVARTFLLKMSEDGGPSKMADIATRMGVNANYAGQYRLLLIDNELIESVGYGRVDFTLPHLRDYLRDHAASLLASQDNVNERIYPRD
jgi:hypothetical protein